MRTRAQSELSAVHSSVIRVIRVRGQAERKRKREREMGNDEETEVMRTGKLNLQQWFLQTDPYREKQMQCRCCRTVSPAFTTAVTAAAHSEAKMTTASYIKRITDTSLELLHFRSSQRRTSDLKKPCTQR